MANTYYQKVSQVMQQLGQLNEAYKSLCENFTLIQDWSSYNHDFSLWVVKQLANLASQIGQTMELINEIRQILQPAATPPGNSTCPGSNPCSPDPAYMKPIYASIARNIKAKRAQLGRPIAQAQEPDGVNLVQFSSVFNQLILSGEILESAQEICMENFTSNVIYDLLKDFLKSLLRCKSALTDMNSFYTFYKFVQDDGSVVVKLD